MWNVLYAEFLRESARQYRIPPAAWNLLWIVKRCSPQPLFSAWGKSYSTSRIHLCVYRHCPQHTHLKVCLLKSCCHIQPSRSSVRRSLILASTSKSKHAESYAPRIWVCTWSHHSLFINLISVFRASLLTSVRMTNPTMTMSAASDRLGISIR